MGTIMTTISVVTMIVTAASLIAASTPTPKDDVWIGKLYKLIDLLALNIGKAKQKGAFSAGFLISFLLRRNARQWTPSKRLLNSLVCDQEIARVAL